MEEEKIIYGRSSKEYSNRHGEVAPTVCRYDQVFSSFLQHPSMMMNPNSEIDGSFLIAKRSKWADVLVADSYIGADENPLIKESLGIDQFYHHRFAKAENLEKMLLDQKSPHEEPVANYASGGGEKTSIVNKRYLPTLLSSSFVRDENIFLNSMLSPKSCKNFSIFMNEATLAEKEKFLTDSVTMEGTHLKDPLTNMKDQTSGCSREYSFKSEDKTGRQGSINMGGIAKTLFKKDLGELETTVESKLINPLKERFNIYKQGSQAKVPVLATLPISEKIDTPNGPLEALQKMFQSGESARKDFIQAANKPNDPGYDSARKNKAYFFDNKKKINFLTSLEDVQEVIDELSVKKSTHSDSIQKPMSFKDSFNENNIQLSQFKASTEMAQSKQKELQKSNQKQSSREGTATRPENYNSVRNRNSPKV